MRQTFDETTEKAFGSRHLPRVRERMAAQGLDAFLEPHEDAHQNESLHKAAAFVDGRYTLQVRDQVDEGLFEIRDLGEGGVPAYLEEARSGAVIGYDPRLHSPDALWRLKAAAEKAGARLKPVADNPVDQAWGGERPAQPQAAVVPHPVRYSGEESATKRQRIGEALNGADAAVLTAPASIAWLFNVRGGDVIRTPLPLGQAILNHAGTASQIHDPAKTSDALRQWLGN